MFAQKIIDSIKVFDFPVKEGIIYEYDPSSLRGCIGYGTQQGASVLTKYDSVFHFEEGKICAIHNYGDGYAIVIRNSKDEFICYSNLSSVLLRKDDLVKTNTYLGMAGVSDDGMINQINIIIFKKTKQLSFKKEMEYIRCNISSVKNESYIL